MKRIYLIGGTMGVGKTSVCRTLKKELKNTVFLVLGCCSVYDNVIFCNIDKQEILCYNFRIKFSALKKLIRSGTMKKLLLFDLDGTLLRTDKTISERTVAALDKCKSMGCIIGISTSRSEQNCYSFLGKIEPNILISSGGALIKYNNEYIYKNLFSSKKQTSLYIK